MTKPTNDPKPYTGKWKTIDFRPHRAGTADMYVDETLSATIPIAGWLLQELQCFDDAGVQQATAGRQVIPGFLNSTGEVTPLGDLRLSLTGATENATVRFAIRLAADDPTAPPPPVVNVTIDGQVDLTPKTRTVLRDDQGLITHVIED